MNRYLIAALYVMAGCAVTIPLKAQGCGESLRGERCRLIITNTVKVVSVYLEEEEEEQVFCSGLPPDYFYKIPMAELIPHVRVQKNSCLIEIYTFQVTVRFLCSDNVSRRCSCSGTIGALASVVLLFLNARPVVSDEPARSSAGQ